MRKRILIVGFLCVFVLILILFLAILREGREADLFKQDMEEEEILADSAARKPTIDLEAVHPEETTTTASSITEEIMESEEPAKDEVPMIDSKDQQDTVQQEAAVETMGSIKSFYYEELSKEIKERINGKSYGENCDVPYEELRYVKVLHWGFDGETHIGEMIVNKAIAEDVIEIFKELYEAKYPIERMVLVDEYDADDNTSMAANNSSAFNYRVIEGTKRISLHSYGMAIDINPLYNPYVHTVDGERVVTPVEGAKYEDRSLDCPYYIHSGDVCYEAFIKRGFTWGGNWMNNKDYQHFQKELPKD